jgi:hypothetical protein
MIAFTEEALYVMRRALRGGGVEFRSEQHAIEGYDAGPVPAAAVPLWLGANGKRMLEVTGRSSDGWVSPLSVYVRPADVPARQRTIDEAARAAGRATADVRRIYNVVGMMGPRAGGSGLIGDVGSWVDTLTHWAVDLGFDTFIFWPNAAPQSQLATFAGEVVPAVRERVSDSRATKPAAAALTEGQAMTGSPT